MWPSVHFFNWQTNYDASFRIARTRCAANHSRFPCICAREQLLAFQPRGHTTSLLHLLRMDPRWRVFLRDTASPLLYKVAILRSGRLTARRL
jgi:hypothetical protein